MSNPVFSCERGSAFLYILIGIILFVSLGYAVSHSIRGGSDTMMSDQQRRIAASDIIAQASRISEAVLLLRSRDIPFEQLSFENDAVNGYTNAGCPDGTCRIFDGEGGGLGWETPPAGSTAGNWGYTAALKIPNIGAGTATLLAVLPDIPLELCIYINEQLGITAAGASPPVHATASNVNKFTGTVPGAVTTLTVMDSRRAGCLQITTTSGTIYTSALSEKYLFYQALPAN